MARTEKLRARLVIPRKTAMAARVEKHSPLTAELRAWLTPGKITTDYVEVKPDSTTPGQLVVVLEVEDE